MTFIDSSLPARERIKLMMSGGVHNKESNIIGGSPQGIANRLVNYLIDNNVTNKERRNRNVQKRFS